MTVCTPVRASWNIEKSIKVRIYSSRYIASSLVLARNSGKKERARKKKTGENVREMERECREYRRKKEERRERIIA